MSVLAIPLAPGVASYLSAGEADELAADLTDLAAWAAATPEAKAAALNLASADVDAALPYHGRPYDPAGLRQFPRVAEDPAPGSASAGGGVGVVWDWDAAAAAPVVPPGVKLATLFQADSILAGDREPRIGAQHDGVVYQLTGTLAESYKSTTGPGVNTGLCRRAWVLMRRYRLRGGRLI